MAQSFRELAVQSPNVTYSTDDLTNIKAEVTEMQSQITSIKSNAEFNGIKRFDGTAGTSGTFTVQVGANAADTVDLSFTEIDLDAAVASTRFDDPSAALATLTTAINTVSTSRATLGAGQSRLTSVVNNLTSNATNLTDARSRIEDTDFSAETTNLAKAQILSQASTAMLDLKSTRLNSSH